MFLMEIIATYLAGSFIAFGICYTLISIGMLKPNKQGLLSKNRSYLYAFLSSWLLVIIFLYGLLKGFFGPRFEKNNEGGH